MPRRLSSAAKLSPKLEAELRDRLEDLLDERDDVADKRRRISKKLGGHLKVLDETVSLTRRQLKGLDLDQVEIPGTGVPTPAEDPVVRKILDLAGGIVVAGGEPAPLVWRTEGANLVADLDAGTYCVEHGLDGTFAVLWTPTNGRSKKLGVAYDTKEAAQTAARDHYLDRAGDELLRGAGADDLAKGPKGPAEAFKPRKGRR